MTEIHETYNPTRKFLALKYLKVVEIKCHKEDKAVRQILKILNTFGYLLIKLTSKLSNIPTFLQVSSLCISFDSCVYAICM
jgi:hypothetical protein